ncbi:MAG: surface-adhesin E family protein [Pseudomonadota bacterium]
MSSSFARVTVLAALLAALPAWAEDWLTIAGYPELPDSDVVQISPVLSGWQQQMTLEVRVTRQNQRNGYGGVPYRSFEGLAAVDCTARRGWYLTIKYFAGPSWQGESTKSVNLKPDEAPMAFRDIPGAPADRIINAACSATPR